MSENVLKLFEFPSKWKYTKLSLSHSLRNLWDWKCFFSLCKKKYFRKFVFNHAATKYPRANSKGTKGNPNNSEPLTVSNITLKVNGIDSKQECLEKHLLEHVCGINIVEF